MTRPDLDAILARVNAATPGPWRRHGPETTTGWGLCVGPDGELVARMCGGRGSTKAQREADAAFLAGAPADIPALVAYARELEATLANERGEGEPPVEGWAWTDCAGWGWAWVLGGGPDEWIAVHRKPSAGWYVRLGSAFMRMHAQVAVSYPTARAAMRAASVQA